MLFKYSKQVVFRANGDFGLGNFKSGNLLKKKVMENVSSSTINSTSLTQILYVKSSIRLWEINFNKG